MDPHFHGLPPLKRFRLMQKQNPHHDNDAFSPILPAKKRKATRDQPFLPDSTLAVSTCSLPAKKRVWALPTDFFPEKKPVLELDLNLEYKPDIAEESDAVVVEEVELEKVEECTEGVCENVSEKIEEVSGCEKECEGEDEDGVVCAVCMSTDGDPLDPIVFCDGCDLMVHATCYGNPLMKGIPEGDWFCVQCSGGFSEAEKFNEAISCCLCPCKGGGMKPTGDGRWAHIVCALYVPEVFFKDSEGREGIDCSKVPKRRWKERCYLCKRASGCAIECSESRCPLAFHVTCGLDEELCIEYREGRKGDIVAGFCKTHTDLWEKQQESGKFKIVARKD